MLIAKISGVLERLTGQLALDAVSLRILGIDLRLPLLEVSGLDKALRIGANWHFSAEVAMSGLVATLRTAGRPLPVNAIDGLRASCLAEAAEASLGWEGIELKSNCEVTWHD